MFDIGPGPFLSSQSKGNDINEAGFITGIRDWNDSPTDITNHAFLWDPTDTAQLSFLRMDNLFDLDPECVVCATDPNNLPPNGNPNDPCLDINPCSPPDVEFRSEGNALNDFVFPHTAGLSKSTTSNQGPDQPPTRGYFDIVPGTDFKLDLNLLPECNGQSQSLATGITTPSSPEELPLIVGYSFGPSGEAGGTSTPVFWENVNAISTLECIAAQPFTDFLAEGTAAPMDVNAQRNITGFDCAGFGGGGGIPGAAPRALYWESHSDPRFVLPDVPPLDPNGTANSVLHAQTLNNVRLFNGQLLLQVVGWTDTNAPPDQTTHGVLWERVGPPNPTQDNWSAVDLNDTTMINRGDHNGSPLWTIIGAYDINNTDEGWIAGVGRRADLSQPGIPGFDRAVLLSPIGDCPADITPVHPDGTVGNGVVNIDDLVALLNAFGDCQTGVICWADISPPGGNGIVNIDDLVAILNAFGACPIMPQPATGSLDLQLTDISNDFTVGFPDAQGNIIPSPMVAAAWAAQQSTVPLSVYRLWAVVDENASLSYAGGGVSSGANGASEPLVLSAGKGAQFFIANNDYSSSVNVALLDVNGGAGFEWFQSQAWATHLFMGGTSGPTKFGDLTALDAILTGAVNTPDSGWGVVGSVLGQPDGNGGWRVLIGQFAVPQSSAFTAAVRLTGDGIDTYATINSTSQVLSP